MIKIQLKDCVRSAHGRSLLRQSAMVCFVSVLSLATINQTNAQNISTVHVQGQKTIDLQYGITYLSNTCFQANIGFNKNPIRYYKFGVGFEYGSVGSFTFTEFRALFRTGYVLYNLKDKIFINGIGGLEVGLNLNESTIGETLDEGDLKNTYRENKSFFSYGVSLGTEIEYYFHPNFAFTIQATEVLTLNSPFGLFHFNGTGGLKYVF